MSADDLLTRCRRALLDAARFIPTDRRIEIDVDVDTSRLILESVETLPERYAVWRDNSTGSRVLAGPFARLLDAYDYDGEFEDGDFIVRMYATGGRENAFVRVDGAWRRVRKGQ